MLTKAMLKAMPPHTIFATGAGAYPEIYSGEIRWAAVRGGIEDWAIYYHRPDRDIHEIARTGDKVMLDRNIQALVPCDQEALELYRG